LVPGLDGPGLAQLVGLTTKDMASIMGLREARQRSEQQAHRDEMNEIYQQQQIEESRARTGRLTPNVPLKLPTGETINVTTTDYLKIKQLQVSAMGTLEKDMNAMRASGNYTEEQIEDYRLSKMGDIGEYTKAVAGGYTKSFAEYQKEVGQARATKLSIGEKEEIAGKTTTARLKATAESEALGPELYNQAIKNLGFSYELEDDPKVKEEMLAKEMERLLGQTFGPKNVSPLLEIPGKGRGFKIRKSDGSTVWKGISK